MDIEEFSGVVGLIHEAGTAPERWTEALAAIVRLVEVSRASLMDIDATDERLVGLEHVGHDPDVAKLYAAHYYAVDPTRAMALSATPLKAFTCYETFSATARARNEYFDFARRAGIGDVVGTTTLPVNGRRSLLSLQRPVDASHFDAQDKRLFELLAAHVALAKRVQAHLGHAWSAKAQLESAFGKLALASFIVDRDTRVRHLNPAAHELMQRHSALRLRGGKLVLSDSKTHAAVQAAIRNAIYPSARSAALRITLGKEGAEVLIAPLHPQHGAVETWEEPLALLIVATANRDEPAIAWRMQQLYRLTPAESRVAAALAVGSSVEEIAKAKRLSEATLRAHLRSIFSKTGTRRQAELVHLALRGATLKQEP